MKAALKPRFARMVAAATIATAGLIGGQVALTAQSASAASHVGWIRLAHLSPNAPAVDVYLYSFGDPAAQTVIHHVSYGTVSAYMQVAAGEYTVAMRLAGKPAKSKPVLSTAVKIVAGHAYTVAGMGPVAGLRLQVIPDQLTTPRGKALVRIIQASMQDNSVNVTVRHARLATHLTFASVTTYHAVRPGTLRVRVTGSGKSTTATLNLAAGTIHTLVVLDEPGRIIVDDLLDAAGSKVDPSGAPQTGRGGTAPRPGAPLAPWVVIGAAGLAMAIGGIALVGRRRRPALHVR